ncbi:hypothetical protein KC320_g42 [Hortaea werneckii]|nr:hypothetical protein KC320_g42 [Hortaea werneckii]
MRCSGLVRETASDPLRILFLNQCLDIRPVDLRGGRVVLLILVQDHRIGRPLIVKVHDLLGGRGILDHILPNSSYKSSMVATSCTAFFRRFRARFNSQAVFCRSKSYTALPMPSSAFAWRAGRDGTLQGPWPLKFSSPLFCLFFFPSTAVST